MFKKHRIRSRIYFTIAALGLITAWWFNAMAVFQEADYLRAWFGSYVDWVLSLDLLIVGAGVITLMLVEAKRLGMKRVWIYFLLSGFTAMAFTFPLFMAFRERKLLQKIEAALRRIEDGSYGYCDETGEPISLSRLEARPIAALSLHAQEMHERMERVHRDD